MTALSGASIPLIQLQSERIRHLQELQQMDQRVGEVVYSPQTGPYMSCLDDVVPQPQSLQVSSGTPPNKGTGGSYNAH